MMNTLRNALADWLLSLSLAIRPKYHDFEMYDSSYFMKYEEGVYQGFSQLMRHLKSSSDEWFQEELEAQDRRLSAYKDFLDENEIDLDDREGR